MKIPSTVLLLSFGSASYCRAEVVINEVHYDSDPKTELVEFVELINVGANGTDIGLWSFSDGISCVFPSGTVLEPGEIILVAESSLALLSKFPGIPGGTRIFSYEGSLSARGERLALANAAGLVVDEVDYRGEFPWPIAAGGEGDSMELINPGIDNDLGGAWRSGDPTPGMMNVGFTSNAPPLIRQLAHFPEAPASGEAITIQAKVTDLDGVASVQLLFQVVSPGDFIPAFLPNPYDVLTGSPEAAQQPNPEFEDPANWTSLPMSDDGTGIFRAQIPGQGHRSLVRYRIVATDAAGAGVRVPHADDPSLNFACFVYDGVPDFEGGGTSFSSEMLTSLPVYTMITRDEDRAFAYAYSGGLQIPKGNAARKTYNWECALVYDGVVYDHVGWRLRQNNDRYAGSGKRSMRFRMNRGHYFQARDDHGEKLSVKWRRFNTSKMSRFGGTNSYGLHETINSKLWRMVGVECPRFFPAHFRMVDGAAEAPDPYNGDFFGLTTIVQDIDGRLLDERELPDGNLYKLKDGISNPLELQRNQTRDGVSDGSDFTNIRNNLNQSQSDFWLNEHVDWEQWARYHAVVEAVRHYDFGTPSTHFKNRAWYFQESPEAPLGLLRIIPHDHDASWLKGYHDTLNGTGNSIGTGFPWAAIFNGNTRPPVSEKSGFARDYRNVIREFRQLLWQPETVNSLIDNHVAKLEAFSVADRARWTGGPTVAGRESMTDITEIADTMKAFAFVSDTVYGSNLVGGRAAFLDEIAFATGLPEKPVISYTGVAGFPTGGLQFTSSAFVDPDGAGTFGGMEWRIAEVAGLDQEPGGGSVELLASGDSWKYFDLGSDPGAGWAQPGFDDGSWDEGPSQLGYGESDQVTTVDGGNAATFFRRVVTIDDPARYQVFAAGVVRDDGVVVYVNGQEVWRNQMPLGGIDHLTLASASASGSNESDFQSLIIPTSAFVPGDNVIAVSIHQTSALSGDMSFDFQLSGSLLPEERIYEWKETWESGTLSEFNAQMTPPALATRVGRKYRARVRHADATGNWGLWSEPLEFVATATDLGIYQDFLVVSEVMYHPADPTAAEIAAGFDDDDFFEFIELRNIGVETLDLSNVRFTKGIDFDFSGSLEPGGYLLVAHNVEAFEMRYGTGFPVVGNWSGKLDNGGERLKLSYGAGEAISDFEYDDSMPWPTTADGAGSSLVRIFSALAGGLNDPVNWRSSSLAGGSPGADDARIFTGDPFADDDGDHLGAFLEFAFGSVDQSTDRLADFFSLIHQGGGVTLQLQSNLAADGVDLLIEHSADLSDWTAMTPSELGPALTRVDFGGGISVSTYQVTRLPGRQFWRVRARTSETN